MGRLFLLGTLGYSRPNSVLQVIRTSGPFPCREAASFGPAACQGKTHNHKAAAVRRTTTNIEPGCTMAIRKALPAGQRENHIDRRLHFHRLAIEKVGLVAKLLHSFERGSGQHRVSADKPYF